MNQLALDFVAPATRGASRRSDPQTSRDAARSIDMKARKREVMFAAAGLGEKFTAAEVTRQAHRMGSRQESGSIRSRLSQLRKDGLVQSPVGYRTVSREQGGTGRTEQLWTLTPEGRHYLEERLG